MQHRRGWFFALVAVGLLFAVSYLIPPEPETAITAAELDLGAPGFGLVARDVVLQLPASADRLHVFDRLVFAAPHVSVPGGSLAMVAHLPFGADLAWVTDADGRPLAALQDGSAIHFELPANTTEVRVASWLELQGEAPVIVDWPKPRGDGLVDVRVFVAAPRDWSTDVADGVRYEGDGLASSWSNAERDMRDAGGPPLPSNLFDITILAGTSEGGAIPTAITIGPDDPAGDAPLGVLTVLVLGLAFWTVWLFRRVERSVDAPVRRSQRMSVLRHLDELRGRASVAVFTLIAASVFFFVVGFRWHVLTALPHEFPFMGGWRVAVPLPVFSVFDNAAAQTFAWLASVVVPQGVELVVTRPLDAAVTQIGISIGLAVMVTFPVLFYQTYAFMAPGLYPRERRVLLSSVPLVVVLFVAGAAFGLAVMTPFMVRVLYGYAVPLHATPLANVTDLVSFAAVFTVLFGLAFQLPAVMAVLTRSGLTSTARLASYWRHALVAIAIVAAFVTDPTLLSQLIVGAVLALLYVLGLGLAWMAERRGTAP